MSGYTKLFDSIFMSTVWLEDNATRIVWIALLGKKDRHGIVEGSIPGLAHLARVTVDEAEAAINKFLAPDPHSRTSDHEGRRIEHVDGGWLVLNHEKYRDMLSKEDKLERDRIRQQRKRDHLKLSAKSATNVDESDDPKTSTMSQIQIPYPRSQNPKIKTLFLILRMSRRRSRLPMSVSLRSISRFSQQRFMANTLERSASRMRLRVSRRASLPSRSAPRRRITNPSMAT